MRYDRKPNPQRSKIQKIAAACLGALFVVLLIKTIAGKDESPGFTTRAAATTPLSSAILAPAGDPGTPQPVGGEFRASGPLAADSLLCVPPPNPFRMTPKLKEDLTGIRQKERTPPAGSSRKTQVQFKLNGIVADLRNGEHVALINDELLRIGDVHRGYTVLDITPTEVFLDNGKDLRVLRLDKERETR